VAFLSVVDLMRQGIICAAIFSVSWAFGSWVAILAVCIMSCLFITQGSPLILHTICMCLLTVKLMKVWQSNFHSLLCLARTLSLSLYLYLSPNNYINETSDLPENRFGMACFSLMGIHTRNPCTDKHTHTQCGKQGCKGNFKVQGK